MEKGSKILIGIIATLFAFVASLKFLLVSPTLPVPVPKPEPCKSFTKLWRLKGSDTWRAFIVAVLLSPVTLIYDTAATGSLTFNWKRILATAIAGGCAYLLKNIFTGKNGRMLTNKA